MCVPMQLRTYGTTKGCQGVPRMYFLPWMCINNVSSGCLSRRVIVFVALVWLRGIIKVVQLVSYVHDHTQILFRDEHRCEFLSHLLLGRHVPGEYSNMHRYWLEQTLYLANFSLLRVFFAILWLEIQRCVEDGKEAARLSRYERRWAIIARSHVVMGSFSHQYDVFEGVLVEEDGNMMQAKLSSGEKGRHVEKF